MTEFKNDDVENETHANPATSREPVPEKKTDDKRNRIKENFERGIRIKTLGNQILFDAVMNRQKQKDVKKLPTFIETSLSANIVGGENKRSVPLNETMYETVKQNIVSVILKCDEPSEDINDALRFMENGKLCDGVDRYNLDKLIQRMQCLLEKPHPLPGLIASVLQSKIAI